MTQNISRRLHTAAIVAYGKAAEVESIVEARGYLIVDQRRRHVFVYARDADGEWTRGEIHGEGAIPIPVLEITLTMDDVYDDIALPPLTVEDLQQPRHTE